ncbi:PepSY domain-containing protein [Streptomyces sp. NBC_01304]|uniref:PepSY domain-containing protein n=1 Tax=Streptomyces sp. NBC_01304 TaxID=2903818 RepID=UPI002E138660|nr:PepSY domain-containing protein [Streptomyces sp. NBC_01304]
MRIRPRTTTRRLVTVGALAGVLALSATACSSGTDGGVDKPRETNAPAAADGAAAKPAGGTDAPTEKGGPKTSRGTATATAEKSVSGGKVTDVELDDGVWKVDVMASEPRVHNISVDATTGALLSTRADRMPDRARSYLRIPLAKLAAATVDRDDAAGAALKAAGSGFVSELSIQGTESRPLWQIEVTDGAVQHEIDVDAKTGKVVAHEKDGDSHASYDEIRERSDNFGKDHYDWSQHVPR